MAGRTGDLRVARLGRATQGSVRKEQAIDLRVGWAATPYGTSLGTVRHPALGPAASCVLRGSRSAGSVGRLSGRTPPATWDTARRRQPPDLRVWRVIWYAREPARCGQRGDLRVCRVASVERDVARRGRPEGLRVLPLGAAMRDPEELPRRSRRSAEARIDCPSEVETHESIGLAVSLPDSRRATDSLRGARP
jgi:hypothetical protein